MSQNFTILTVCTGNLCRSPLAELLFARRFEGVPSVRVCSAGTRALPGHSMPMPAQEVARELGAAGASAHRAKQVTEDIVTEADLVLAMTREHRRSLVTLWPRATRRTFTIREFADLAEVTSDDDIVKQGLSLSADPAAKLRAAITATASARSNRHRHEGPADDDIIDPYGRGREVYSLTALQLAPAVDGVAALLRRALHLGGDE